MTLHYHGTPITPRSTLLALAGRNFCVSFAEPRDVQVCHEIGQSVMLDNGAFTTWRQGREMDWDAWARWAEPWLDRRTTWAVLPDTIDGDEADNDRLLIQWSLIGRWSQVAPVWHLHEPIGRLVRLCEDYERVCFGSSGAYREVGSAAWHQRVAKAFNAIADENGRVPWIHMLRGMSLAGDVYPFASLDSTDIARNHYLPHKDAVAMADRWDGVQCPGRWQHYDQLELEDQCATA